jgi:hypothetical protein
MAISDAEKLDLLWKKIGYGTSKTASAANKAGSNETVASAMPVLADSFWAESSAVSATPPVSDTTTVKLYTGANRIRCTQDPTAPSNQTWFATTTFGNLATHQGKFIPTTFGSGYLAKVYIGDPNGGPAVRIFPDTTNEEYYVDYMAGVVTFFNTIPSGKTATIGTGTVSVSTHGIYIEIYQYIGATGATATKSYVVADIAARDAIDAGEGDTVHVKDASAITTDAGAGEWANYIYTDGGWTLTSTQDSARSDSLTTKLVITSSDTGSISLGKVGNGARVVEVSVEVTDAFDGDFEISVGDAGDNDRLMGSNQNDLQTEDAFVSTPIYQFPANTETEVFVYITGTATQGSANVIITYA